MRQKIGITFHEGVDDKVIIQKLLWTMQQTAADFTNTFRLLSNINIMEEDDRSVI